jgi:hypothetical protein
VLVAAVVFMPCLGCLGLMSLRVSESSAPASPTFAPVMVQAGPRAILSKGKLERDDAGLRFEVDYVVRAGGGAPGGNATQCYVWVVRSGGQTIYERELKPDELGHEGTLQGRTPAPADGAADPVETFLEIKHLAPPVPPAGQRECISNVVTLEPEPGRPQEKAHGKEP